MRVSFEVELFGQTFHLSTHPVEEPATDAAEGDKSDVVTGVPSSVEFGFASEPESDYWGEDRHRRR